LFVAKPLPRSLTGAQTLPTFRLGGGLATLNVCGSATRVRYLYGLPAPLVARFIYAYALPCGT